MNDINQQIAKIDDKCTCENPGHAGNQSWCNMCRALHRPDYLAPENLHELVRVAMQTADNSDSSLVLKYRAGESKFIAIIIGKGRGDSDNSLSQALAEAIIEAQG